MNIWPFGKRKEEIRADTTLGEETTDQVLIRALLGNSTLTKEKALEIPTVQGCINVIAGTIASLPFKLYHEEDKKVREITNDRRVFLLNYDTGDTLNAKQFWKAVLEDYFFGKGGYVYINRSGMEIQSLHYVDEANVSIQHSTDPIFKDYNIMVQGKSYFPHQFLKILRKTKNGADSRSIIEENSLMLDVVWNTLNYENNLVKKGGNKRGFLKSPKKLSIAAMDFLKDAFKKLYGSSDENVIVLNEGIEFQEASSTSVEMQLNENKAANADEICKIFNMPPSILNGNATEEDNKNFIRYCIMTILNDIECSLDRDLLYEYEKESYYFAADTKQFIRGNTKERYEAYKVGLEGNFLQIDEVREMEDMEPLGINWLTLGLDQVLYDPETGQIYTPNTNQTQELAGHLRPEERSNLKNLIITGPPGSGKSTWVHEHKKEMDLVLDLDTIKCALLGNQAIHAQAEQLVPVLAAVRDAVHRTARDYPGMCYIITTETDRETLKNWANTLKAEVKVMNTPIEVCKERVTHDQSRPDKQLFYRLIDEWFEKMKGGEAIES